MILMAKPNMVGNERKYMNEAFDSNWIAPLGPFVDRFENDMSKYLEIEHAVALSSGTAALHLAMIALGIKNGDVVLCPDTTFVASINPAVYCGATPIFVDIDYHTLNISIDALKEAIKTYKPKALIMVHIYGMPCSNADEIIKLCKDNGVIVIEDATEALGSTVRNELGDEPCGTLGDAGCFSFNGNKIITTSGGGMMVTNNKNVADHVRSLATQAKCPVPYYLHDDIGYNYRLSNISAAIGVGQLENINYFIGRKNEIHDAYANEFGDNVYSCGENCSSNYWLTVMKVRDAHEFVRNMKASGIETRRVWTPLHMQPCYTAPIVTTRRVASSKVAFDTCVCMPSDPSLTEDEVNYIIKEAKKYV